MAKFSDIKKFSPVRYSCNIWWTEIDEWIKNHSHKNIPELDPEFQRGHVWTEDKQVKYVEFVLRGGKSGRDIYWNFAGYQKDFHGRLVLVDGKQRLEAIRRFLNNEIPAFGSLRDDYDDVLPSVDTTMNFHVNNLETNKEVMEWYLDLNDGGVVHTQEELEKVRKLIKTS